MKSTSTAAQTMTASEGVILWWEILGGGKQRMLFVSERRWLYNSASCFRCISLTSLPFLGYSFWGHCFSVHSRDGCIGLSWTQTDPGGQRLVLRTLDHRLIANILQLVLPAFHTERISLNTLSIQTKIPFLYRPKLLFVWASLGVLEKAPLSQGTGDRGIFVLL